jgi:excinuclease ABC subunit C
LQNLFYDESIAYKTVISQFYMESNLIPPVISLPIRPSNDQELQNMLSSERNSIVKFEYPKKGEKAKELRITMKNAEFLLNDWILKKNKYMQYVPNSILSLQGDLNLEAPPKNIEGFDISHLAGTDTVASMVSFIDGKPRKKNYRKFKIKTVNQIDDFASIREVVFRRYSRLKKEKATYPDLILVDGGKGQLSMAMSALRELGLDYIPVIGLAKRLEEVFVPGNSNPQSIHKDSAGLVLLKRIRDEAHRFAITFQRQKRKKTTLESPLLKISGIGDKTIKKIFSNYDGTADLANQTPDSIFKKIGLSKKISKEIISVSKTLQNKS